MWQRVYETRENTSRSSGNVDLPKIFNSNFDNSPITSMSSMMKDDLQWVSQPRMTSSSDDALTNEKFRIVVNTEGFQPADIDVYTVNRKLHINAFRHEESGTGTQSTKRLERCYDIPSDADTKTMSIKFSNDRKMIVEFAIAKHDSVIHEAALNALNDIRQEDIGKVTRSSSQYMTEQVRRFGQPPLIGNPLPNISPHNYLAEQHQLPSRNHLEDAHLHRATLVKVHDEFSSSDKNAVKEQNTHLDTKPDKKFGQDSFLRNSSFSPRIVPDKTTGHEKVVLSLEVHGYDPSDFHVTINNLMLCVEAKHIDQNGDQSKRRYFQREVTLPVGTDVNQLKTVLIDGCQLEIEAPYVKPQYNTFSVPIRKEP